MSIYLLKLGIFLLLICASMFTIFFSFTSCGVIPKRFVLAVMAFLGIIVALMLRNCLSVAITKMVIPHVKNETQVEGACPIDKESLKEHAAEQEAVSTIL